MGNIRLVLTSALFLLPGFASGAPIIDLAPTGVASQSSDFEPEKFVAGLAIDGIHPNFTHTNESDSNPWWRLDFDAAVSITGISLFNRNSGCGMSRSGGTGCEDRFRDITVSILGLDGASIWSSPLLNPENILSSPGSLEIEFFDAPIIGYSVIVARLPDWDLSGTSSAQPNWGDQYALSLSEVSVMGSMSDAANVPEPGTLALFGLGLVGFRFLKKKRLEILEA